MLRDLPRLGHIDYLNSHPLYAGLLQTGAIDEVELVTGTPTALAAALHAGELDAAPLSLIEYLRNADRYLLLPGLAIGSRGAVQSVRLVGRVAPEELNGPVAMTDASATSQVLLAILMRELWRNDVQLVSGPVDFPDLPSGAEATLLIGDDALRLDTIVGHDVTERHVTDLGTAWHELTGLPMVFAVWAVRREFAYERPDDVARVCDALHGSLAWSRDNMRQVVATAPSAGLPERPGYLDDYFKLLDYGLGARSLAGIATFARFAHALDALEHVTAPRFVPELLPAAA